MPVRDKTHHPFILGIPLEAYMVDVALVIFGIVAVLAIGLGVTLYRVVPCWVQGETIRPEGEHAKES